MSASVAWPLAWMSDEQWARVDVKAADWVEVDETWRLRHVPEVGDWFLTNLRRPQATLPYRWFADIDEAVGWALSLPRQLQEVA